MLLDWHEQDPPDSTEIARTRTIEAHQGMPNPFVLDATLAARAFGPPPVHAALASFAAEQTASGVRVTLATSAETGVHRFRVDGRPDAFGAAWQTWGAVDAAGQPSEYIVDVAPEASGGSLAVGAYRVGITALNVDEGETFLGDVGLTITPSTSSEAEVLPRRLSLSDPAPNPASGATVVAVTLAHPAHVRVTIYDVLGRAARVVHDGFASGEIEIRVDTSSLASGVYTVRATDVEHGGTRSTRLTVSR